MKVLDEIELSFELQQVFTTDQAWHYGIIPKAIDKQKLELFIDETKFSVAVLAELEMIFGRTILAESIAPSVIKKALGKYYLKSDKAAPKQKAGTIGTKNEEDFLSALISEAKQLGSSDIHLECYEERCRVRIRIDGLLVERYLIPRNEYPSLVNKIKIKANLDIAEKRLPQDGRIFFKLEEMKFDIRVSVLPTLHGEKIVLRLLSNDATNIDLHKLGFTEKQLDDYLEGIKRPHGIMLISGPTGSGKTTTLYATLKLINKETTNIVTIEDPIEYTLEGINQVHLKESIGLGFASALRTFLRQDPDVIMLGEIRDAETAQMAIRAALTGHLVLSTIHTNSAWGTVSRLAEMGVPPFLIAGTLNATVAQRLVRLLCPHCKETVEFHAALLPKAFRAPRELKTHAVARGCASCYFTGYRGRKAIYEIIPVDIELSEKIKRNQDEQLGSLLRERNISTLSENAFRLLEDLETSVEEVYPVLFNSYD